MEHIGNLIGMREPLTTGSLASTRPIEFDGGGFQTLGDKSLESLLESATRLCRAIDAGSSPRWLSLLGPSGSGKTHLAIAIGRFARSRAIHSGIRGVTAVHDCLFRECHTLATSARNGDWHEIDFVSNAWFVVLDDMGAARDSTGFVADVYMRILNRRLGKWTVITSNLYAEEIAAKVDSRIASRMFRGGSEVCETTARDWSLRA